MSKWVNKLFSLLYTGTGVTKPIHVDEPMTEQQALDTIPDDWLDDVDPEQLEEIAKEAWTPVILQFAKQVSGLQPTENLALIIKQLSIAYGVTEKQQIDELKNACLQNAKIEVFAEIYGDLFEKDDNGDLSYSPAMIRKITGLDLPMSANA
jgi:hypothetical protein